MPDFGMMLMGGAAAPKLVYDPKSNQWLPVDQPDSRFAGQQIHVNAASTEGQRQADLKSPFTPSHDIYTPTDITEALGANVPVITGAMPGVQKPYPVAEGNLGDPIANIPHTLAQFASGAAQGAGMALSDAGAAIGHTISPYIGDMIWGKDNINDLSDLVNARFRSDMDNSADLIQRNATNNAAWAAHLAKPLSQSNGVPQIQQLDLNPPEWTIVPDEEPRQSRAPSPQSEPSLTSVPGQQSEPSLGSVPTPVSEPSYTRVPTVVSVPNFGNVDMSLPPLPPGPEVKSRLQSSPGELLSQLMALRDFEPLGESVPAIESEPKPASVPQSPSVPMPRPKPTPPQGDNAYTPTGKEPWAKPGMRTSANIQNLISPSVPGERRIAIHRGSDGRIMGFSDGNKLVSIERDAASGRVIGMIERELNAANA